MDYCSVVFVSIIFFSLFWLNWCFYQAVNIAFEHNEDFIERTNERTKKKRIILSCNWNANNRIDAHELRERKINSRYCKCVRFAWKTWAMSNEQCSNVWFTQTKPIVLYMRNGKLISIFCFAFSLAVKMPFLVLFSVRLEKCSRFRSYSMIWIMHHCFHLSRQKKVVMHLNFVRWTAERYF